MGHQRIKQWYADLRYADFTADEEDRTLRDIENRPAIAPGLFYLSPCLICVDPRSEIRVRSSRPIASLRGPAMIRLGIVDYDTSHASEFTKRLNHVGIAEDQWVEGAKVVAGCPGTSQISPERIPGYTKELE